MDAGHAPKNRQELLAKLSELRQQGVLDAQEEAELVRHFDAMLAEVETAKAALQPEFERRVDVDGEDDAKRWLVETAEALGHRQGRATREITDRLRVVGG
ncbi:MAG: hypothetical protein ACREO8_12380 [Luteimonas sp.]